jgi:hypothetical protein
MTWNSGMMMLNINLKSVFNITKQDYKTNDESTQLVS